GGQRAHTGVFQEMVKSECHFINSTEWVRYVQRYIYNRQQYVHFDSDVGFYVGDTPDGGIQAQYRKSQQGLLEYRRGEVDRYCRHNYKVCRLFILER
ncbi:HB2L protein, partial [Pachyramphus minor]|nr:HB2L protein [Pachyramphus minor]